MGVCYTLIMQHEGDFNSNSYENDKDKKDDIPKFQEEFKKIRSCCDLVGRWYGYACFDIDKASPWNKEIQAVIKKYSENAWFISDIQPWRIEHIDEFKALDAQSYSK